MNNTFKLIVVAAVVLMRINSLFGQKNILVNEGAISLSTGSHNGYTVSIDNVSLKEVTKQLKAYLAQSDKKVDIDQVVDNEFFADDIKIASISAAPIDAYFKIEEGKNTIIVSGLFMVNGNFVSSTIEANVSPNCEIFMRRFALRAEKLRLQDNAALEEKLLSKKQDEQKSLEKERSSLNTKIADAEKIIVDSKAKIEINVSNQEAMKLELQNQQKIVEDLKTELGKYQDF